MDAAMRLITQGLGTSAARSFCRCLLLTSLAPHGAPSVTFPPGTLSSPLHQLVLGMVSISCQLQPGRVSIPPRRSFLLANSRLFSGWRESNKRSLPGQGNRKPCKHSEEPSRVQSVPRAVPRAGAMRAEGRERESHVSLRQPCCAADPYVPTRASITGCEGGRGSAQRRVGGEEGDWCQACRPRQGQGPPSLCHCSTHDPTLSQAGNRGLFSLSFAPGGLCPLRAGTSQATRGAT